MFSEVCDARNFANVDVVKLRMVMLHKQKHYGTSLTPLQYFFARDEEGRCARRSK